MAKDRVWGLIKDLTGQRFGFWTVLSLGPKTNKATLWICRCICGKEKQVSSTNLVSGMSTNCGCQRKKREQRINWNGYGEMSGKEWYRIREGAKSRNLEFMITKEYIYSIFLLQNKKCALTGLDIEFGADGKKTASLDRIDSTKGYIEGNIQWVHKDINLMKNHFDEKYFITMCRKVAELSKN